ncbi:hypothetical protein [Streptomyces jumonjinensis]|uniref:hypothetical protein n=1 Tax=Streptomyces jumonjinensis TaxID=1945 RepID=UPI0037B4188A
MSGRRFHVLLGPDGAGKSSVMEHLAERLPKWRLISTDDAFVAPEHALIPRLRRELHECLLPGLGAAYSVDFLASVLQTAVVHLRDQVRDSDPRVPVLMDSYYYKILAKCRLAGAEDSRMYSWWRSFPQPSGVVFLDVSPGAAWRRRGDGTRLNALEYDGPDGGWADFERYQENLRKTLLEEVRALPVTMLREQPDAGRAAEAVLEVLTA